MIDYDAMKREHPRLKAQLTRAVNSKDPAKVHAACIAALTAWMRWGAWPDNWSNWQRALDDTYPVFHAPRLEDLDEDLPARR